MKILKFKPELAKLILIGEKTSTWRLFDDKNLQVGDKVEFVNSENGEKFAEAVLIEIDMMPFGKMTPGDMDGHEKYSNEKEMLEFFSECYKMPVTLEAKVKIIRFNLIRR